LEIYSIVLVKSKIKCSNKRKMKQPLVILLVMFVFSTNGQSPGGKSNTETKVTEVVEQTSTNYKYKVLQLNNNTWVYDIYKDEKILIHQTSIPGMPGNDGFKNKTDAEKVARLVIEKLKKGEMPPTVSIEEMKNLKVL
jgi:hypothetical protein